MRDPRPARCGNGGEFELDAVITGLAAARARWRAAQGRSSEPGGRELPSFETTRGIIDDLHGALFPMRLGPADLRQEGEDFYIGHVLDTVLQRLTGQARLELRHQARLDLAQPGPSEDAASADIETEALRRVRALAAELPRIRALLDEDVLAAFNGDPAARSVDEVLLCYPGIAAMIHHRVAHELYRLDLPLLARIVNEIAHRKTGIDIHPGAEIGAGFFIDHGTGVVIGETACIGERVRLYQAVTLGAKSFPADGKGRLRKGLPRHPIVEDDVVIYAGATILGRITIGRGSVIGGNVWLTRSVAAGSHVSQATTRSETVEGGAGI